jgi:hypothetical protein
MSDKRIFSVQLGGSESSRDPVDELIRLAAKWRRERNLDDSAENLQQSALAVFKANPKLADRYKLRPTTMASARPGTNPWDEE